MLRDMNTGELLQYFQGEMGQGSLSGKDKIAIVHDMLPQLSLRHMGELLETMVKTDMYKDRMLSKHVIHKAFLSRYSVEQTDLGSIATLARQFTLLRMKDPEFWAAACESIQNAQRSPDATTDSNALYDLGCALAQLLQQGDMAAPCAQQLRDSIVGLQATLGSEHVFTIARGCREFSQVHRDTAHWVLAEANKILADLSLESLAALVQLAARYRIPFTPALLHRVEYAIETAVKRGNTQANLLVADILLGLEGLDVKLDPRLEPLARKWANRALKKCVSGMTSNAQYKQSVARFTAKTLCLQSECSIAIDPTLIHKSLQRHAHQIDSDDLAKMLRSIGAVSFPETQELLSSACLDRVRRRSQPSDRIALLVALATNGSSSYRVHITSLTQDLVNGIITDEAPFLSAEHCAGLLDLLRVCHLRHKKLEALIESQLIRRASSILPEHVATVLASLVQNRAFDSRLKVYVALGLQLEYTAPLLSLPEVDTVLSHFSRVMYRHDHFLVSVAERVEQLTPRMTPSQLSSIVLALGILNFRHGSTWSHFKRVFLDSSPKEAPLVESARVLWSFSVHQAMKPTELRHTLEEILGHSTAAERRALHPADRLRIGQTVAWIRAHGDEIHVNEDVAGFLSECTLAMASQLESRSDRIAHDLVNALKSLDIDGLAIEDAFLCPDTTHGYVIDAAVGLEDVSSRVAFLVNSAGHYARGRSLPSGISALRRQTLEQLGWAVCDVHVGQWGTMEAEERRTMVKDVVYRHLMQELKSKDVQFGSIKS